MYSNILSFAQTTSLRWLHVLSMHRMQADRMYGYMIEEYVTHNLFGPILVSVGSPQVGLPWI